MIIADALQCEENLTLSIEHYKVMLEMMTIMLYGQHTSSHAMSTRTQHVLRRGTTSSRIRNDNQNRDVIGHPQVDQHHSNICDNLHNSDLHDCYSVYHHITLKEEDQLKTSFIMFFGTQCYIITCFLLKNFGSTYQPAIQDYLSTQIKCNGEAYVDDMSSKPKVPSL